MATKNTDQTLTKVGEDEPIFVLRAQDLLAPDAVEFWVSSAAMLGVSPEKLREAENLADAMRDWQEDHDCKLPD